jgi:hypothetical protein
MLAERNWFRDISHVQGVVSGREHGDVEGRVGVGVGSGMASTVGSLGKIGRRAFVWQANNHHRL